MHGGVVGGSSNTVARSLYLSMWVECDTVHYSLHTRVKSEGLGRRVGGVIMVGGGAALVVDGVVEQHRHERPSVGSVPLCHSELLIHFLKLQQLQRWVGHKGDTVAVATRCVGVSI